MGFALNDDNATTNNTNAGGSSNNNRKPKADGFINIYLPTKGGGKIKVGYLTLSDADERQKDLRAFLEADANNIQVFANKAIFDYNPATVKEGNKFDLG